jgi:branched-chain amino acid aminotransferase
LDIPLEVRPVDRSELYIADELFFCGSSARITPIVSVDKRPVGDGKAGVVTSQLLSQYEAMQQGKIETFADFVTTIAN